MRSYLQKFRGRGAALPVRLPLRATLLAGLGAALTIGLLAALTKFVGQPLLLGSLGASCVFAFGLPDAPFSQPRNIVCGHVLSSGIGLLALKFLGPQSWALALALGATVIVMFVTRTVHAPAGSNPVIVFLTQPGWSFLLAPTLLGAVGVVFVALLFNNTAHPGRYPLYWLGRDSARAAEPVTEASRAGAGVFSINHKT